MSERAHGFIEDDNVQQKLNAGATTAVSVHLRRRDGRRGTGEQLPFIVGILANLAGDAGVRTRRFRTSSASSSRSIATHIYDIMKASVRAFRCRRSRWTPHQAGGNPEHDPPTAVSPLDDSRR